jgi:microcompartment protein CcmK/EutM
VRIGLISGIVAAEHKDPALNGLKLLAVQELDLALSPTGSGFIVADSLGAGRGDLVLITNGTPALHTDATANRPVDAVVVAILQNIVIE